jgi:hypothetical protein
MAVWGARTSWLAFALASLTPSSARAWLFEEHANIGRNATHQMPATEAAVFDRLWVAMAQSSSAARERFCPVGSGLGQARGAPTHNRTWACVDFGAMPAAGGDHSCSPDDLWDTLTRQTWFRAVYADAAETERLLNVKNATAISKDDAWHQGNLILGDDDPEYLSRAAKNNAHFVLARGDEDSLPTFMNRAVGAGAPLNATAAYSIHHLAALATAAVWATRSPSDPDYLVLARDVLTSEAFALHFLEDSFSAGHFVGLLSAGNGTLPERAGTHDYYCQYCLAARSWAGTSYAAYCDAFMKDRTALSDLEMASAAVVASLEAVLDVAAGNPLPSGVRVEDDVLRNENVCNDVYVSAGASLAVRGAIPAITGALTMTPEPYREEPALPHFRSEFGALLRGAAAGRGSATFGDDISGANPSTRFQFATQVGLGFGGAAEGLTTHTTDGVFYVEGNILAYGQDYSSRGCLTCTSPPPRFGWGIRARLPFWLIPGDLFVGAVLLLGTDQDALLKMAIKAAQGSLWWRFEKVRPLGQALTLQIVAGREAALFTSESPEQPPFTSFHMTELELPLVELRTKHLFSDRLGSDALLQLGGTVDWSRLDSESGVAHATTTEGIYARIAFDEIYYFYP